MMMRCGAAPAAHQARCPCIRRLQRRCGCSSRCADERLDKRARLAAARVVSQACRGAAWSSRGRRGTSESERRCRHSVCSEDGEQRPDLGGLALPPDPRLDSGVRPLARRRCARRSDLAAAPCLRRGGRLRWPCSRFLIPPQRHSFSRACSRPLHPLPLPTPCAAPARSCSLLSAAPSSAAASPFLERLSASAPPSRAPCAPAAAPPACAASGPHSSCSTEPCRPAAVCVFPRRHLYLALRLCEWDPMQACERGESRAWQDAGAVASDPKLGHDEAQAQVRLAAAAANREGR